MKRVTKDQLCTSFSADNPPALRVQLGETFVMETNDRFAVYEGPDASPETMEVLKTMAGPVYVEGAKPGDTLKIDILDVNLPLAYGWIGATPGRGPLGKRIPEFRKTRVQITEDGVVFNDKITLPCRPMLGRIGLAPKEGPLPSIAKGDFGGGMGNTQIAKGAMVYLPVFHAGGPAPWRQRLIPVARRASRSLTPWADRAPARGLKSTFDNHLEGSSIVRYS